MTNLPATATIADAAKLLNVSTKTLRRWEARGVLMPVRTDGGHRRYELEKIRELKGNKRHLRLSSVAPSAEPAKIESIPVLYTGLHIDQKKVLGLISAFAIFALMFYTGIKLTPAEIKDQIALRLNGHKISKNINIGSEFKSGSEGTVLAAVDGSPSFNINIESAFKDNALFTENVQIDGTLTLNDQIIGDVDLTGVIIVGGNSITSNQTTFNLLDTTTTTLNVGGAATTINLGPAGSGASSIVLAGGSTDTGCTIDGSTGALTCSGGLTSSTLTASGKITGSGDLAISGNATFGDITSINGVTYSFPDSQGSDGEFLSNDGSGNLEWETPSLTGFSGVLPIASGGTNNSTAYTAGSVIFSDGTKLTQDNANFYWDDTNNRLGIGNTAPTVPLDVTGAGTFSSTLTASNGFNLTTGALNMTSTSGTSNLTSTATSGNSFAFTNTALTSDNSNLALLTFQNANTGTGTLVNGLRVVATGSTPSGGTNTQNLISLSATTLGSNTFNGIYFNTGLSNYVNSSNWEVTAAGAQTMASDLAVNGGNITTSQTTANLFNTNATTLNVGGAATTLNLGATTGTTTIANSAALGDAITDGITFTGRVAQDSDLLPITTTGTNDLGSALLPWDNVYANVFTQNGNLVCDASGANCPGAGTQYWGVNSGALYALNNSVDLLLGGSATTSAKFAFTGVASGTPTASVSGTTANVATYLTGNGNLATTNFAGLTLGGATTGNITLNPSNSIAGGFVAPNTTNVTDLGTASLVWRNIYGTTIAGTTLTQGGNGVCDSSGANCPTAGSGGSKWRLGSGAISPFTDTLDVLIGSTATTSAKFAFLNVNSGLPTASVSGTTANVATYLTGNGNLATTNFAGLTLGGATTGNITLNPSNSIAGGFVAPNTTNVTDLGTSSLLFRNIYGTTIYQGTNQVCDVSGNCSAVGNHWQLNNKIVSPANSTYDLAIGGTATGSAFQVFGSENPTSGIAKLISSVTTTGDVLSATASAITSGNIVKLGTGGNNGNFTGNGLYMDFDNTGGSSFTGNFLRFDNATSTRLTVNSSGNIAVAAGSGLDTITAGTLGIGTTTANAVSISKSGTTTTVNGALTSAETLTASNGLTLTTGALNLTSTSGTSNLTSTATSGDSFAFTNTSLDTAGANLANFTFENNNTGAGLAVGGIKVSATGSTPSGGTNTANLLDISATALANNTFNGINFGNGLTNYINGTNFTVTAAGNVSALGGLTVSGGTINLNFTGTSNTNIGNTTGTTTVAGHILPATTNTSNLGSSSSLQFNNIYANAFIQNGSNVCDSSGANCPTAGSGGSKWKLGSGTISPFSDTLDVLIGSSATTSAKFAFTGVAAGTPTASISGTTANVATYLTGEGNLATTNMADLTLGGSTTGNIILNSRGSTALTANATNVTVAGDLTVSGGDLTGANSETIDIGEADNGSFIFSAAGETNNESIEFDLETTANTLSLFSSTGVTAIDLGSSIFLTNIGNGGTDFDSSGGLTLAGTLTANGTFAANGTVNLGDGGDVVTVSGSDTNIAIIDGSVVNIDGDGSPTADLLQIGNGDTSATADVDGLLVNLAMSNASGDSIHITPALAGGATDALTYNGIELDAFSPTNAAGTDIVNGLKLGNLTDPGATITSTALNIGTGWDSVLSYNGTPVINGSGQVVSTQITGTLFSNSSDSNAGTNTVVQGDTLTISGGTNGVDTSLNNDTYTINLDTTEIGTTTFGSGSSVAWTFNTGTTDPILTFGDNTLTVGSAATITATDVTAFNCTDCLNFDDIADSPSLDAATDINLSTFGLNVDLDSTGDFAIRDGATAFVTFNEDNLGQVVLADGAFLDLSAILHDDTTIQGFRLPQNTALTNPASGEGFLAWDTDDNQVKVYNGSAWSNISGASTTLQEAYSNDADGSDTLITLDATDGSLIVKPIAGTSFQVAQVTSAPTTDIVAITNTGLGTTTTGVDGLSLTFVTGDGATPTNNGINLDLTSGGTAAGDVLNGINFGLTGTSGTERGINFSDNNFDTDINATTDLTIGIGGTNELTLTATNFSASTAEGNSLGSATLEWEQLFLGDDNGIAFGLDQDWTFGYDEATDDRLELVTAGTSGALIQTANATGTSLNIASNSLTTGTGLYVNSSSITTGTLMTINATGTTLTTGKLFDVQNNSSSVFNVAAAQITSALPHQFTAAGDVNIAYDLVFTNQTASTIDSYGPLTIRAGESFENNNLTLSTYGNGKIIADGGFSLNTQANLEDSTTPSVGGGSFFLDAMTTNRVITTFDDGTAGQIIVIEATSANIDLDCVGASLSCGTTDPLLLASGDIVTFIYDGTIWNMISLMNDSTAGGNDIAEYFPSTQSLATGEIVKVDPENPEHVIRSAAAYESSVVGIVSTDPGITLGAQDGSKYPIALAGRVPVKISQSSQSIIPGDYITTSSEPGRATKAVGNGRAIGQALENWSPDSGKSEIVVFINNTWYEPVQLTANGDVGGVGTAADPNNFEYALLTDSEGNVINKLSGLVGLIAENIKSAYIEVALLKVDNLLVNMGLISPSVLTNNISPLADETDINIQVGSATESGKLAIKNATDEIVAEIDSQGNATFSGEIRAGTIYADQIIAKNAQFGDTATNTLGGITREEIEALLNSVEQDQNLLNESQNWSTNTATGSAILNELSLENLYVTGTAAMTSLSLSDSLAIGGDMVISSLTDELSGITINSIDTLTSPLSIQSSASQPLYIMAGKVQVDTAGNMQVLGNLAVGGVLSASAINIAEDPNATVSATLTGNILNSLSTAGEGRVASGSADITIVNPNIKTESLIFVTPTSESSEALYVKSKDNGTATVGFKNLTATEVTFNWWIVNLVNGSQNP